MADDWLPPMGLSGCCTSTASKPVIHQRLVALYCCFSPRTFIAPCEAGFGCSACCSVRAIAWSVSRSPSIGPLICRRHERRATATSTHQAVFGEVSVQSPHRPVQLAVLLGLCAVFIPPVAHAAGIVPDGGTATTVTTGTNGRPVVNIAPSTAG
ncbi:hemagglutinin, partial [Ralstonia solanacearum]